MHTSICVQIIHTTWTKKSRGGEIAGLRNAVPLAQPFEDLKDGCLSVQRMTYTESDSFQAPNIKREQLELTNDLRFKWGGFVLAWDDQIARTEFHPADWSIGAPGIKAFSPVIGQFTVAGNEWVRLRWQGRFSGYDDGLWWYEHTCVNVARFDANQNPHIFFKSDPARQFVHLPSMW